MSRFTLSLALGTLVLAGGGLAGCRGGANDAVPMAPPDSGAPPGNGAPSGSGAVRVVNGVSDSASLTATVSGAAVGTAEVPVNKASPALSVAGGTYAVQLQPNRGGGFAVRDVPSRADTLATVVAYGALADGTQGGFVVTQSTAAPAAGQVAVQPVFGAYTASGNGAQNPKFVFLFNALDRAGQVQGGPAQTFGQSAAPVVLSNGTYRISITPAVDCTGQNACPTVVQGSTFDSGTRQGVALPTPPGAAVIQVVAVDATEAQRNQYGSGVVLLLIDSAGTVTTVFNDSNRN